MNKRQLRREANWRAGEILRSILSNGWHPEDLDERYGEDVVVEIAAEINEVALMLCRRGGEQ